MKQRQPTGLIAIFKILRGGYRVILLAAITALIISASFAFILPESFTATASFIPPGADNGSSASALMGQLASMGATGGLLGTRNVGNLYVAILRSHTVAQDMVRNFDLMRVYGFRNETRTELKLESRSFFAVDMNDPVVTIAVTDNSPQRARDLAAGFLDEVQKTSVGLALTESSQRRLFFEKHLGQEKDQLADAEVALKQVEERTGLISPAGQTASNIQALAQIQAQITGEQSKLAALLHDETEQNPDVLRSRSEIASLQAKAAEMENGQSKGFGRLSTAQVPATELEYVRRAREVKYHETLFDILAKQYEGARLDEAKDAPLQILDRPTIPDVRSGPPRAIIMAVGMLAGVLFSAVWLLLRASRFEVV